MVAARDIILNNPDLLGIVMEYIGYGCILPLMLTCRRIQLAGRTPLVHSRFSYYSSNIQLATWITSCVQCPDDAIMQLSRNAAATGNMTVLEWAKRHAVEWDSSICAAASKYGQYNVLKWLRELTPPCPWNADTPYNACRFGHLDIIRYVCDNSSTIEQFWDVRLCAAAAEGGHLKVLQYLRSFPIPCPWSAHVIEAAAAKGWLHIIQWARACGPPCPWDAHACSNAARYNQRQVLIWLREQYPPCPWDVWTFGFAARMGHVNMLQLLCAQHPPCPCDIKTSMDSAASGGHLDALTWLHSNMNTGGELTNREYYWDESLCLCAVRMGHIHVLEWLRSQNPPCPWTSLTCTKAAEMGQLEVLKWLRAQNPACPWVINQCLIQALHRYHGDVAAWLEEKLQEANPEEYLPHGQDENDHGKNVYVVNYQI